MHLIFTLLHAIYKGSGRSWSAVLLAVGAIALLMAGGTVLYENMEDPKTLSNFWTALSAGLAFTAVGLAVMPWDRWRHVLGVVAAVLGGIGTLSLVTLGCSLLTGHEIMADGDAVVAMALRVVFGPIPLFIGVRLIRRQGYLNALASLPPQQSI